MKKSGISLITLLLCCISLYAQQRSATEAIRIASEFLGTEMLGSQLSVVPSNTMEALTPKKVTNTKRSVDAPCFYVVNDEANNRFVIVSADERMYKILGYSDSGTFDEKNMPVALFELFDGYEKQYEMLHAYAESFESNLTRENSSVVVEPLITTKWGQTFPYNDDCPINKRDLEESKCYSGCVATAMAQVMNYYEYPSKGKGSYLYISDTQKHLQAMDFGETTFEWDKLIDVYGSDATAEQNDEVAKLMHACGVAVSMDYGNIADGQSGAFPYDIPYAMINYFGYNPNLAFKKKDYYTADEWDKMIMDELKAGRPIIYAGYGSGGHCFILDGCDGNGLYHFNFGQTLGGNLSYLDGYGNGYYSLDAIKVKDALISLLYGLEELGDYTNKQNMICQISPNAVGGHEDVFYASTFSISSSSSTAVGSSVNCNLWATNYSSSTSSTDVASEKFNGEVGIALYDAEWNFIKSLFAEKFNKHSNESAYISEKVLLDKSLFKDGNQYIIAPYAKSQLSDAPTRIRMVYGKGWYLAKVDAGKVSLVKNGEPDEGVVSYPEIPTGTIYASALGAGDKQTVDVDAKPTVWQLTLTKDPDDPKKYWFDGFDPAVSGNHNRVYGFIDEAASQICIPIGQKIGSNLSITNFTNSDDIIVDVSSADSTMMIADAWGTLQTENADGNMAQVQLSLYVSTKFSFKPFVLDDQEDQEENVIIDKPLITVDDSKVMSISCNTDGVEIHYTLDGKEPTKGSPVYQSRVPLTGNCTIKAIAYLEDNFSEIATFEEDGFVVDKPVITQPSEFEIEISCLPNDAQIYYTLDGSYPTKRSIVYKGKFTVNESCVIKAIGVKDNYRNSEVTTFVVGIHHEDLVVNNNLAGNLGTRISDSQKSTAKGLVVTGELNGTDIVFIRDMIMNGQLTNLNIENAVIVSGGDSYYVSALGTAYGTIDNVVGSYMFDSCSKLISLRLPSGVTSIESFSFWGCENLKELRLPDSCTTVEDYSFYGCSNLDSFYLGAKVEKLGGNSFVLCDKLYSIQVAAENKNFKSEGGVLYTTDHKMVKYPVGRQDDEFIIPAEITVIGRNAFEDASVSKVIMPDGLVAIESSAFANCENLCQVEIPDNVAAIGHMAFWGCTNLNSVDMPQNLSEIESNTFNNCINLRDIIIGKNVQKIADNAFDNCSSLQRFIVEGDNSHFVSENGLLYTKDFKVLKRCPQALFSEELRLPDGIEEIAPHALDGCINIKAFRLPETLNSIGLSAFSDCKMTSLVIPNSVKAIGNMAFWNCDELQTFALPEGLEEIAGYTFYNCEKLEYVYIPSSVGTIESQAFYGCKSLNLIECKIQNIDDLDVYYSSLFDEYTSFENVSDTCIWRIPCGTSEKYKNQPWWISSWRIVEDCTDNVDDISADNLCLSWSDGYLSLRAEKDEIIRIYSINGTLIKSFQVKNDEEYRIGLPAGIYIIKNKKIVFR